MFASQSFGFQFSRRREGWEFKELGGEGQLHGDGGGERDGPED